MQAADTGGEAPLVHDSSMPLLAAAINSDPNPQKGVGELVMTEGSALVASAGPEGTIADLITTEGASTGGVISTYTVKDGDSISSIAAQFGVSVNTIRWANNLTKTSLIKPGSTLVILPVSGIQHTVQRGETLAGIAKKYGADAGDIASYNGLDAGSALSAGDTIIIPGGEVPSTPTTSSKASSTTKSSSTSIKQGGGLTSLQSAGGAEVDGYYGNPVPGALLTQGVHGWNGVDLGAPAGTPVYAAAAGTVIVSRVGGWNGGYGNYVVIRHANGTQSLYSHLSKDNVSVGQSVSRGQAIGAVGRTGEATGNHLHFEVRGARNPFASCSVGSRCTPR